VASIERVDEFGGFQIFMDTADTTELLADDIRDQLADQGFTAPDQELSSGQVFLSTADTAPTMFCSADGALVVNVTTLPLAGSPGATLVSVSTVPDGPCSAGATGTTTARVLPRLAPPVDTRVLSGGVTLASGAASANMVGAEA